MNRVFIAFVSVLALVGCGPTDVQPPQKLPTVPAIPTAQQPEKARTLAEARQDFKTALIPQRSERTPVPTPPPTIFRTVQYESAVGKLSAFVSVDPKDGKKHPAIVWIQGGDFNSIDEGCWKEGPPDNDQSAAALRKSGIVMMFPALRGGNDQPGEKEGFYGEVNDVIAAADFLAQQEYVDPNRIYLGGHSTGGTLVLLVSEFTDRFRAVFAFGPVAQINGYGSEFHPFATWNPDEIDVRSPGKWLAGIQQPTFVFEGTSQGNVNALRAMDRSSTNPKAHFLEVRGADHFNILHPTTRLIAEKLLHDDGPKCNLTFTEKELSKPFEKN